MAEFRANTLYYGDNLDVLRDFPSECVDLVYLDPPFNSNRSYNVLFKEARGTESEAQIQAFGDTWHWYEPGTTAQTYHEVVSKGDDVGRLLKAFVDALGRNDVTAYLTMMAPRLVELRRVMKPTASIYLHCDPTASHYLKVLMDAVFDPRMFMNEVVWKRSSAHSDTRQGMNRYGKVHDVLLVYALRGQHTWNPQFTEYSPEYLESEYRHIAPDGRRYKETDLTAAKPGGDTQYEWRVKRLAGSGDRWQADLEDEWKQPQPGWQYQGVTPYKGRIWAYSKSNLVEFVREGRIIHRSTGMPRLMHFADEMPGTPLQDFWDDIPPASGNEHLGYPTQKPEALLERIIAASSNPGDLVLDPFCGCGTATTAAQRLGRKWIGIDITYLAVDLIRRRLAEAFPEDFDAGIRIEGEPADEAGAIALAENDPFQFQFWSVAKLGATARGGENRRGPDRGVDGVTTFPERDPDNPEQSGIDYKQVIISVKGGHNVGPTAVRDLRGVLDREDAAIGVLVTAHPPTKAMRDEAAEAGLYVSTWDGSTYPRIQIITGGDIVHGARIQMPSQRGLSDFARAPRARRRGHQASLDLD